MDYYKEKTRDFKGKQYYYPNLIERLQERDLHITDLAKAINRDYYQVGRKINGVGELKMRDIKKIIKYLGGTFEYLFYSPYDDVNEFGGEDDK